MILELGFVLSPFRSPQPGAFSKKQGIRRISLTPIHAELDVNDCATGILDSEILDGTFHFLIK